MVDQLEAITGRRKRKRSPVDEITARAQFLPARRRAAEDKEFGESVLEENIRANRERERIDREALEQAEGQATTSNIISGVSTVGTGAFLAKQAGLIGKAPSVAAGLAPAAGPVVPGVAGPAGIAGGAAPAVAGPTGITAPVATGAAPASTLSGFVPAAGVAAIQLAKKPAEEFVEEQVGTSAKPIVSIGARAGQGALIAGPIGAAVGTAVGVAEETFGWMEDQLGTTLATVLNPIGAISDWADDQCIVITACTDPHSYEVEVARIFRDECMGQQALRGYYMLGEKFLVPLLKRKDRLRGWFKRNIVDRWIEVAEDRLDIMTGYHTPRLISKAVAYGFLYICKRIGKQRRSFTRRNGEVF